MTPHNGAQKGEIAKTVLMPGDPMRAKFIAETYLQDAKLVNQVRGMYAYTGTYKGKEITVMASGMGMPSIGIYSYELYKFYDVENIIRVGSAGSYDINLPVYDLLLVENSYSDSSFARVQNNSTYDVVPSSEYLNQMIVETAQEKNQKITVGTTYSTDVFYRQEQSNDKINEHHCLACEMETFALFHTAKMLNKQATCILTISDHFVTGEETTAQERETGFKKMIELALDTTLKLK
jgi:purine nucleoside phosphorylase